jgi:cell division protein FtsZ
VQGITDLITTPGLINLDFADVKSVMQGAGSALMGIGSARGEDRAVQAAELAISSPLLEASIEGAHGVLLSVQGGSDLGLFEINEAARLVQEAAHPEANIIFGAVIDDSLGDEVRVTVIAAGFDGGAPIQRSDDRALGQVQAGGGGSGGAQGQQQHSRDQRPPGQQAPQQGQASQGPPQGQPQQGRPQQPAGQPVAGQHGGQSGGQQAPAQQGSPQPGQAPGQPPAQSAPGQQQPGQGDRPPRTVTFEDDDDLDVPDFLK